jgi:hypothetical protein
MNDIARKLICVFLLGLQSCGDPKPVKPAPVVLSAFGHAFASQQEFEAECPPSVYQKLRQSLMEEKEKGPRRAVIESLLNYKSYGEAFLDSTYESGYVFLDKDEKLVLEVINNYQQFRVSIQDNLGQWEGKFYACSAELRDALKHDVSLKLAPKKRRFE